MGRLDWGGSNRVILLQRMQIPFVKNYKEVTCKNI